LPSSSTNPASTPSSFSPASPKPAPSKRSSRPSDSYGTHACDTDTLAECLREAFIEQYSQDVLENFRKEVLDQLPVELRAEVPPVPPKGTLDLEAVKESRYFFA
jgi:DNA-directed RNA polymerase